MSLSNDYQRTNHLVEKFLRWKVQGGRSSGVMCAGDIERFAQQWDIIIPSKFPIRWITIRMTDALNNGLDGYQLKEIRGFGKGPNIRWCRIGMELQNRDGVSHGIDTRDLPIRGS